MIKCCRVINNTEHPTAPVTTKCLGKFFSHLRPTLQVLWIMSAFPVKNKLWDFPGGREVKNLPANAGDAGSIPDPGRVHILRSN